jgi:hypothetical protein
MESQDHATNRVAQNALPNASKSSEQSCFEKEKCPCCNPKTQKPAESFFVFPFVLSSSFRMRYVVKNCRSACDARCAEDG